MRRVLVPSRPVKLLAPVCVRGGGEGEREKEGGRRRKQFVSVCLWEAGGEICHGCVGGWGIGDSNGDFVGEEDVFFPAFFITNLLLPKRLVSKVCQ